MLQLLVPILNAVAGLAHHAVQQWRHKWLFGAIHSHQAKPAINDRFPVLMGAFLPVELKAQSPEDALDLLAGERRILAPHPALGGLKLEWLLVAPEYPPGSVKALQHHRQVEQRPVGQRCSPVEQLAGVGATVNGERLLHVALHLVQ